MVDSWRSPLWSNQGQYLAWHGVVAAYGFFLQREKKEKKNIAIKLIYRKYYVENIKLYYMVSLYLVSCCNIGTLGMGSRVDLGIINDMPFAFS